MGSEGGVAVHSIKIALVTSVKGELARHLLCIFNGAHLIFWEQFLLGVKAKSMGKHVNNYLWTPQLIISIFFPRNFL